jgi:hypothetical protein
MKLVKKNNNFYIELSKKDIRELEKSNQGNVELPAFPEGNVELFNQSTMKYQDGWIVTAQYFIN